jgi:5-oxoprolinase (ATP-hydrolysing) subunit A
MAPAVDLNSDLGEGFGPWPMGDDEAMLDVVTSANVACGFHAGDPRQMRNMCGWAAQRGIAIGAHVAYRDLPGFGRRFIDVAPDELTADVLYQLGALEGFARAAGARVRYVKPHGALYNTIVHHEQQAAAVVDAIVAYDPSLAVLCLSGSRFLALAEEAGLPVHTEAFADRAYTADGTLVPRREAGAVLTGPDRVAERCVAMVRDGRVEAIDGSIVEVAADSICVHGDTPGATALASAVRQALTDAGVTLRPFVADARP